MTTSDTIYLLSWMASFMLVFFCNSNIYNPRWNRTSILLAKSCSCLPLKVHRAWNYLYFYTVGGVQCDPRHARYETMPKYWLTVTRPPLVITTTFVSLVTGKIHVRHKSWMSHTILYQLQQWSLLRHTRRLVSSTLSGSVCTVYIIECDQL